MKNRMLFIFLVIGLIFSSCQNDEIKKEINSIDASEISSTHQLKTPNPLKKFDKEIDKALKDLRKVLKDKVKEKKAKDLGISVKALPEEEIPEDELLEELTEEDIVELMENLESPSKSYLDSYDNLDYSQYADEVITFTAFFGAKFEEGLYDGITYDLSGDIISVYQPVSGDGPIITLAQINECCRHAIETVGYTVFMAGSGATVGALATRSSIKVLLNSMLGSTVAAAIPGMIIGWMVADALWCIGHEIIYN